MEYGDVAERRIISETDEWNTYLEEAKEEFYSIYRTAFPQQYSRDDFDFIKTIGTGAFGRVYLASSFRTGEYYAIKMLSKAQVVSSKQVSHTINEKNILQALNFPFCVHLEMSFQDNSFIYMCLPFIRGGELFTHLRKSKKFSESLSRFYGAQVLLAFEYLHYLDMIYRDLKPENILVDANGYLKLTDFGFCKLVTGRTYTLCGTPEYLAPEILANKGYGRSVDWWAYGVLLFEMVAGFPPFQAPDPMQVYEKIMAGRYRIPSFFSEELADLVTNLLQIDLTRRYGNLVRGVSDVKEQAWFKPIDFLAVFNGTMEAPYIPNVVGASDTSNFTTYKEVMLEISKKDLYAKEFMNF